MDTLKSLLFLPPIDALLCETIPGKPHFTSVDCIQVILTPITPYVAPTKKKLLLYAERAVEKREHMPKQKH